MKEQIHELKEKLQSNIAKQEEVIEERKEIVAQIHKKLTTQRLMAQVSRRMEEKGLEGGSTSAVEYVLRDQRYFNIDVVTTAIEVLESHQNSTPPQKKRKGKSHNREISQVKGVGVPA